MTATSHTVSEARFRITWDGSDYRVSIPCYDGGEVVKAESYDRLRTALRELVEATEDTLRSHLRATECCAVTRERCKKARALLSDDEQVAP